MPNRSAQGRTAVAVSAEVIDPGDLAARIDALLAEVDMDAIDLTPVDRRTSSHPYVDAARRAELLHQLWGTVAQPEIGVRAGLRGRVSGFTKRVIRRASHWYVEPRWTAQHEIDAEVARFATDSVAAAKRTYLELRDARQEADALRRDVETMQRSLDNLGDDQARQAEVHHQVEQQVQADRAQVGAELNCLAQRQAELERIVLDRADARDVAKLRDEVVQLMSRLGVSSAHGAEFNYVEFEDRFRGDSAALAETQRDYVTKFPGPDVEGLIVDVGCGRGEMLQELRAAGHDVLGVDLDDNMIALCTSKGLPVVKADGVAWLTSCSPNSLKGVFSAQVVEHMLTPEIERFIGASLAGLRPGGVLVVETINPRSLHALGNHFFADLSHVRPVHPETLRFICEHAGFADVALTELSPHPAVAATEALGDGPVDDVVRQLVTSVFGNQDYAIVATKGADGDRPS